MPNIIIDEEFKALLPALDKDTYAMLEENLLKNGCRDSIVLWGDILIVESPREEIKVIASAIENGTYEKGGNAQPAVAGTEKPIEGMASAVYSLETSVKALSNSFSLLHEIKSIEDRVKIKTALRSCIDKLEDLYGQI